MPDDRSTCPSCAYLFVGAFAARPATRPEPTRLLPPFPVCDHTYPSSTSPRITISITPDLLREELVDTFDRGFGS